MDGIEGSGTIRISQIYDTQLKEKRSSINTHISVYAFLYSDHVYKYIQILYIFLFCNILSCSVSSDFFDNLKNINSKHLLNIIMLNSPER